MHGGEIAVLRAASRRRGLSSFRPIRFGCPVRLYRGFQDRVTLAKRPAVSREEAGYVGGTEFEAHAVRRDPWSHLPQGAYQAGQLQVGDPATEGIVPGEVVRDGGHLLGRQIDEKALRHDKRMVRIGCKLMEECPSRRRVG